MRYVLLKHEKNSDFHVDFLLDCGGERLLSWQICEENFANSLVSGVKFFNLAESPKQITDTIHSVCRRNFDHRKIYLNCEGEIGENRGRVICVECGEWDFFSFDQKQIVLQTNGGHTTTDSPIRRQWQFLLPFGVTIEIQDIAPANLMQRLPPPGDTDWYLRCRLLC